MSFAELLNDVRQCKMSCLCPTRNVRQFYFENEDGAARQEAMFICHSPATRTGFGDGSVREHCWRTTKEDLHFEAMRDRIGLKDAYITNCMKCGSTVSDKASMEEQRRCTAFLQQEIDLIRPRVIALVGGRAAAIFHRHIKTDIPVMKVPHYSWSKRKGVYDPVKELSDYDTVRAFLDGKPAAPARPPALRAIGTPLPKVPKPVSPPVSGSAADLVLTRLVQAGIGAAQVGRTALAIGEGTERRTIAVKSCSGPKPAGGTGKPLLDWWVKEAESADFVAFADMSSGRIWLMTRAEVPHCAQQNPPGRYHFFMYTDKMVNVTRNVKPKFDYQFDQYLLEERIALFAQH